MKFNGHELNVRVRRNPNELENVTAVNSMSTYEEKRRGGRGEVGVGVGGKETKTKKQVLGLVTPPRLTAHENHTFKS